MPEKRRREWEEQLPAARALVARLETLACGCVDTHGGRIGDWQELETQFLKQLDQLHRAFWEEGPAA